MNLIEIANLIRNNIQNIKYEYKYLSGEQNPYYLQGLGKLKLGLRNIKNIPYIQDELDKIESSWLFKSDADETRVDYSKNSEVEPYIKKIQTGLEYLLRVYNSSSYANSEDVIYIRLPELHSFEELARTANDLKKSIEIPVQLDNIGGDVEIVSAESGSIWLIVSVGSIAAINLVGSLCWAAMVLRKKHLEAKIFEQHLKTLELKNSAIEDFVMAQKSQLSNILTNEAEAISNKHYNRNEPENIERLKLSINTIADLIEKGTQILPASKDSDTQKLFPDYNKGSLIESSIKQIMGSSI
ncbi:hypothetical protein [Hymenobacter sp. 102]|uniref:hypothetical protein n=1 Tax=Hymenobacter sp. 102 TaxID=3403152 RepID=UPI003CFB8DA2